MISGYNEYCVRCNDNKKKAFSSVCKKCTTSKDKSIRIITFCLLFIICIMVGIYFQMRPNLDHILFGIEIPPFIYGVLLTSMIFLLFFVLITPV